MIINEDEIRKAISSQLKEWVADDLNRRFSRFEGTDTEDIQCNLDRIPDGLFVMILTAFPGVFYKAKSVDSDGIQKILGLFAGMTSSEKESFRLQVKKQYAKKDIKRLKKAVTNTLDLAFPGTSFIVCSQITSLAKLFGAIFGVNFDIERSTVTDEERNQLPGAQSFTNIMESIAETAKRQILDNANYKRRDTLLKFNFETFMIFPSVVESFASDNYTDNIEKRKRDFESAILSVRNSDMSSFHLALVNYYSKISDSRLRDEVNRLCEKIINIEVSNSELKAIIDDLDFRCDFAYNNLKIYL